MEARPCELCNREASLFCASDSAFLCWDCDGKVHRANFLVARHIRHLLCSKCKDFAGKQISSDLSPPVIPICRSCSPETPSIEDDSLSSSSPSECVSSNESCATAASKIPIGDRRKREMIAVSISLTHVSGGNCSAPVQVTSGKKERQRNVGSRAPAARVDSKAEEVFMSWSKRLGVKGHSVTSLAAHALGFWLRKLTTVAPFRVAAAAAFWFGLRFRGDRTLSTFQNLRRLEVITGVPAKVILAGEAKLARAVRERRARRELEEGWAES